MSVLAIDFTQPFEDAFGKLLGFIPNLLGGLVILAIGYFVAKVLGKLVGKLLGKVGFDQWMERAGVSGILQRSGTGLTASAMLGKVVFWFVFLISFTMFASALGVPEISSFMSDMLGYIPRIFAAIVIICLAALFANFLAAIIRGATGNETLAKVGKYADPRVRRVRRADPARHRRPADRQHAADRARGCRARTRPRFRPRGPRDGRPGAPHPVRPRQPPAPTA